MRQQL
ncbi:Protein of unknown function [Leuconostoc citreum]